LEFGMNINSVSKPAIQPTAPPKSQAAQHQTQRNPDAQKAVASAAHQKPAEPKPTPVLNSQGQVTGRHLNVSA
jgi:hypothetical protein